MASFSIRDTVLNIPDHALDDTMRKLLENGYYEGAELRAIDQHLRPDDRVLELGAGAGYLAIQIAKRINGKNLLTVEANPQMVPVVEKNLALNSIADVTVINAAVVPDDFTQDSASFHMTAAFWSSSLNPTRAKKWKTTKTIRIPAVRLNRLMQDHKPSFVVMDIEGGEQGLFDRLWPEFVRLVVVELHPALYPDHVIKQVFDQMSASGLTYCPKGSRGTVVVFKRLQGDS